MSAHPATPRRPPTLPRSDARTARGDEHLEVVIDRFAVLGRTTTSIVRSPRSGRPVDVTVAD
jgi:hypothetical protein